LRSFHAFLVLWLFAAPLSAGPETPPVAPTTTAAASARGFPVYVAETEIVRLRAPAETKGPDERARQATNLLRALAKEAELPTISTQTEGELIVVYANGKPLLRLTEMDAQLDGDPSLAAHAEAVSADIRKALQAERRRGRIANNVFSASLVVFFGLIAFFLMRRTSALTEKAQGWVEANGDRLTLRIREVELVGTEMLQSASVIALGLVRWLGQLGIFYAWLVASLSLFETTRGYTQKLTGVVLAPASQLMGRIAMTLPLLVVAIIAALAVFVLVRFVGLFFARVSKRETTLAWVAPDLAAPISVLLRLGIVVSALLFLAPIVTGDAEGAIPRIGVVALAALGLASTPLLATALVGTVVVFGRRLRVGEYITLGSVSGRVVALTLLEIRVDTERSVEARLPMLTLLRAPLLRLGFVPQSEVELVLAASGLPSVAEQALRELALKLGRDVRVELRSADAEGQRYRVGLRCDTAAERAQLLSALVEGLATQGIKLGRSASAERAS
jgi:small-conductance mechanosensitive channel